LKKDLNTELLETIEGLDQWQHFDQRRNALAFFIKGDRAAGYSVEALKHLVNIRLAVYFSHSPDEFWAAVTGLRHQLSLLAAQGVVQDLSDSEMQELNTALEECGFVYRIEA
jgi:hypothetical protein